jgi:hypothetical protein
MTIENVRVLFLPHAPRQHVLGPLMRRGKKHFGWRVGIMVPFAGPGSNAELLDDREDFFGLPELSCLHAWESDPVESARIGKLVRDCEKISHLPMNRIVLAGERVIGRGYGREFYYWTDRDLTRRVLVDNEEPGRVVARLFAFTDQMLSRFQPDLVLGGQITSVEAMVISLVCRSRGIPCFANRPSKIHSDRGFWTDDRLMTNGAARDICRRKIAAGETPSDEAKRFLMEFRSRPRTVAYIQRNWASAATFLKRHFIIAIQAASNLSRYLRGVREREPKPIVSRLLEIYRSRYLIWRQRGFFSRMNEAELAAKPYIYLALHKEPELAINVQHPEWHSQKNLIAWLSANLPAGYRLLVREHRFNAGRRPTRFYKDIRRYPGVTLVDAFDTPFKYIRHAALVTTDSGTTGFEALIFGRPLVLLGENYYSATGLAPVVEAPGRLGDAILATLDDPTPFDSAERDRRLGVLVDAELETTVLDDDIDGHLDALARALARHMGPDRQPHKIAGLR